MLNFMMSLRALYQRWHSIASCTPLWEVPAVRTMYLRDDSIHNSSILVSLTSCVHVIKGKQNAKILPCNNYE